MERKTAKLAAIQGYDVALHYRSNEASAKKLCDEVCKLGAKANTFQADISSEAQVVALFDCVQTTFGRFDALVNNAGAITPLGKLVDMDKKRIQKVFDINVLGNFLCAREAVKIMSTENGGDGGAIVNVSSIASRIGSPNEFIDYAATKGAIDTFTIGLSKEVAAEGIRVNAVRPGLIATEIHAHTGDSERAERLRPAIPMQRVGGPEEVAPSIMWLLSDEARYVTGALIGVSGGR